ncbi:hypothetical protein ACFFX1_18645 [Dactylosporangium sucinum]|uniref:Uncharacterized protein n=1 Tax=Dactylosporangium sucinum TaxID=1424081 RepID=A0A917WYN4_9ACTN|nr:hypothetical protein [Dactylosporangium sucinum]GGM46413.1 hypothetical protein GCM10007977_055170 [Dactylosporangium sucinum]
MSHAERQQAAIDFRQLLDKAAQQVADPWFALPYSSWNVTTTQNAYRERVYCYELYHQIRVLSDSDGRAAGAPLFVASGELNKSGLHSVIQGGKHQPDLVWHVPGNAHENAVVVEIKSLPGFMKHGPRKDLETLAAFLEAGERSYERGILLIYGSLVPHRHHHEVYDQQSGPPRIRARVLETADELQAKATDEGETKNSPQVARHRPTKGNALSDDARRRISVLWHPHVGQNLNDLGTLERLPIA